MLVDLVDAIAVDGVRLDGALHPPAEGVSPISGIDAVIMLHGTGSNFYSSSLWSALIPKLRNWGVAVLAVNTRGHDGISAARQNQGRKLGGAAYEIFDECRHDVTAWAQFLAGRGYQRVALLGHSSGAVKAVYSLANEPPPNVACLLALSPPRLSYAHFAASPQASIFLDEYNQAKAHLEAGRSGALMEVRFPLPFVVTAAGYLDKYGPDERYNVLQFVDRVPCPALYTYGSIELDNVAFRGMPDLLEAAAERGTNVRVAVVAGADHLYSGVASELETRLRKFVERMVG
jgi:pimeloyl-ACP methyl ester carboxylesterase